MQVETRLIRALVPAFALVLLAGCGGVDSGAGAIGPSTPPASAAPSPSPTVSAPVVDANGFPLPVRPDCAADAGGEFVLSTTTDGNAVGFLLIGKGTGGVVLAPQDDGDICQWLPYAQTLAAHYRVALFAWKDPRPEVMQLAVSALRDAGARRVVLGGASYGGALAMSEAHRVRPAPAGVLSLGGEIVLPPDLDGREAIKRWHGPLLAIGSEDDDFFNSANAIQLRALHPGRETVVMFPGEAHGVELLDGPHQGEVRRTIERYLAAVLG